MNRSWIAALPLLAAVPATAQQATPPEAALKAHVAFLASDAMKGRDTGSPELTIAEQYVAAQMEAAGLKPGAGAGGWLQKVPLVSYRAADHGSLVLTDKHGTAVPLEWGKDYLTRGDAERAEVAISGPVVFAGYGVVDRAAGIDDYRGLDVRGKIVALIRDAQASLPSDVRAHYGRPDEKAKTALAKGAAGVLFIEGTARRAVFPFEKNVGMWDAAAMSWGGADGKAHATGTAPAPVYLSQEGAAKLFAGSRIRWDRVIAADKAHAKLPTGALAVAAQASARTTLTPVAADNVVGLLEGSDPALRDQYVVLSAHLDHVGVGKPDATGDTIYNGAMDNAVGTASMLEVAKRFQASGQRPRRSILFVAVTAEEKGLVGSDYFAANPVVPAAQIVADVNLDMPILTYRFEDLVVYGADRTTIGPVVQQVAAAEGVSLTPDPEPEQAYFVRSDHYSFVKAGIPAVSLEPGPKGPGKAAIADFVAHHYHQPSDQVGLIDWSQGVRFVQLNYAIARALSDGAERAKWNQGDFFGLLYGGYGAK